MSKPTVISPAILKSWLDSPSATLKVVVIDVRDEDRYGGHIRNSVNVPSSTFISAIPNLADQLQQTQARRIVFHCQLSQVRGPSCAGAYFRHIYGTPLQQEQEIYILQGGFSEWARQYGRENSVTENYKPQLYEQL
ncbi:uncharacterized protein SAPINGB_P006283 [Magnusiomyces paraingens]|uniref:Rhodanese domain-containing protein n=1 Tax=Magnusiomyces paraingens TaxID=2606893 RepID=A0A5E8CB93_9ASCO|nr:uncharacterized protein SAPINGB_P006283 [Saprochaete ingens]VVT58586.1 unnamed protein product [Saprochaete ingens]